MTQPDKPNPPDTTPLWRLDVVCSRFEKEQVAGRRPRIEYFLRQVPAEDRDALLEELVGIEIEYRRKAGEEPSAGEYRDRFPKHFATIDAAFSAADEDSKSSGPAETMVPVVCANPLCGYLEQAAMPSLLSGRKCPRCGGELLIAAGQLGDESQTSIEAGTVARNASVPALLGRFQIKERLGAGGFGVVYRALDPVLKRDVAIKVPKSVPLGPVPGARSFIREARAAARLSHPNIVQIHDVGRAGEAYYIAYAYVESKTLSAALKERRFDPREAARITLALAGALDYAHRSEIVHCDIKPQNVLLTADGTPLITDFGLARLQTTDESSTDESAVGGTLAYMAPEHAAGDRPTPQSDQYSLGVLLYEVLTGQKPFQGPNLTVLSKIENDEPVAPRRINPAIPRELEAICQKAMNKESARRYASCQAMADDLARYLKGEAILARPSGWLEAFGRWAKKPQRIRDAGAFTMFTAALFVLHQLWGIINVFWGTVESVRPNDALFWLTVVVVGHGPVCYIGWRVLHGSKVAIYAGILVSLWGTVFNTANITFGFFDAGGLLSNLQEIRVLHTVYLLISAANLIFMSIALYARRHWRDERW